MLPSGLITKQVQDKIYVLVGLKDQDAEKSHVPGEPAWIRFDTQEKVPYFDAVPEGKRIAAGVNLPI